MPGPQPETCGTTERCYNPADGELNSGTTYYWKVTASDGQASTDSAVRSFVTQ